MIELRNVTKVFNLTGNEEDKRTALDHVNLKINDGEFVTIIGSNGSGKSTSINIICGSLMPDDGRVVLSGMDITNMKEYERAKYFGRVFQDPMMGTTAEMSCLENLEIAYRRGKHHSFLKWGFSNSVIKRYYKSLLEEFDLKLEDRLDQKVGVMSGGQRQALTLLMAAMDPRLDTRKEFIKMNIDINTGPLASKIENLKNDNPQLYIDFAKSRMHYHHLMMQAKNKHQKEEFNKLKNELKTSKSEMIKTIKLNKKEIKSLKKQISALSNEGKIKAGSFYDEQKLIYDNKVNEIKLLKINQDEKEDKLLKVYIDFSNTLHNYNQDRRILLLDEHTAALDPKTASKVLNLTNKIVREKNLTTLMVTHNMRDALTYGDRLIMFHNGHIIHDFSKKEKAKLKPGDLVKLFDDADQALIEKAN